MRRQETEPSGPRAALVARLVESGVYLVTDDTLPPDELLRRLDAALAAGVRVVQLRDKRTAMRAVLRLGEQVAELCARHGALLLVNDRADLALALDAAGLHVGQDDLPPEVARRLLGPERLLGLSASFLPEVEAAERLEAVDYIGFGALYPTATKLDAEPAGLELLRQARQRTRKPIVGIGGITADTAAEVIRAGADAVAVVSAVFRAPDAGSAARTLLDQVRAARIPVPGV